MDNYLINGGGPVLNVSRLSSEVTFTGRWLRSTTDLGKKDNLSESSYAYG